MPPALEQVMVVALVAWLLLASTAGTQWEQDFNSLKAINIQGKLVLLKKYNG